jgi:hypothetical protein
MSQWSWQTGPSFPFFGFLTKTFPSKRPLPPTSRIVSSARKFETKKIIFFQINMTLGEGAGPWGDVRNLLAPLAMIFTKLNKNLQKKKLT